MRSVAIGPDSARQETRVGHVEQAAERHDLRVVDQDLHATEPRDDIVDALLDLRRVHHVADERLGHAAACTNRLAGREQLVEGATDHRDVRPFRRERLRDAPTPCPAPVTSATLPVRMPMRAPQATIAGCACTPPSSSR